VAAALSRVLVRLAAQQPVGDQPVEAVGEHLARDRRTDGQLVEAPDALEHLAEHQQGPPVADHIERPADAAVVGRPLQRSRF
jgi:hypothetical protein